MPYPANVTVTIELAGCRWTTQLYRPSTDTATAQQVRAQIEAELQAICKPGEAPSVLVAFGA